MEQINSWITSLTDSLHHVPERIAGSLAVIAILVLLRWATIRILERHWDDVRLMYHVRKTTAYGAVGVTLVVLGLIWSPAFRNVGTRSAMVVFNVLTPKVWTSIKENGVSLTIRYLCEPRQRRGTAELISEDILTRFGEHPDIEFAYPTTRWFRSPTGLDAGGPGSPRVRPDSGGPI